MKKTSQVITMVGIVLSASLVNQSCTKAVKGCTDKKASNYNPTADVICNSCCVYTKDTLVVDSTNGNILFYSTENTPTVTLSNGKVINADSNSTCTDSHFTNHASMSPGTYTYTATNAAGMSWNGTFLITTGQCTIISLSTSDVLAGKISFSTDNTGLGAISVSMDGKATGNITPYIYSPTFAGPGFDVSTLPGAHSYTASSANGQSWSGTVNVTSGNTAAVSFQRANVAQVASTSCNIVFFSSVEPDYTVHFNNTDIGSGVIYSPNGVPLTSQNWIVSTVVPFGTYTWWATTSAGKYFSGTVDANAKNVVAVPIP